MSLKEKPDTFTMRIILIMGLLAGIAIVTVNGANKYQKSSGTYVGTTKE